MLTGSVAGGYVAQLTSLGVPFLLRGAVLIAMFALAFAVMRDVGFTPRRGGRLTTEMRAIASASIEHGWRVPAVKWIMLSSVFTGGVGFYVFYALQPYLLELAGRPEAYGIAGLVAAIVAGADIVGGIAAPWIRRLFHRRTSALLAAEAAGTVTLGLIGAFEHFWVVLGLIVAWSLLASAVAADSPRLPQRDDSVGAAGDHPVLRLAARLQRRRGRAARARARSGRVGLRDLLCARSRHLGVRAALHRPVALAQGAGGHGGVDHGAGDRGGARLSCSPSSGRSRMPSRVCHLEKLSSMASISSRMKRGERLMRETTTPGTSPSSTSWSTRAKVIVNS